MIEPRINQPRAHPLGRLAPTRDEIEEVLSVFGGPEDEGRGQEDRWFDGSFRQLRIVAVVQPQRFGMQHVVADVGLRRKRFHHGLPRCLDSETLSCVGYAPGAARRDIVSTCTLGVRQYPMWDADSVALLKELWVSGHSAGQI